MKSEELKIILDKIMDAETNGGLKGIANKAILDRSNLSTLYNNDGIDVSPITVRKLKKAFPDYFKPTRTNNSKKNGKIKDDYLENDISFKVSDLINEKEARRLDAEKRNNSLEKQNDKLVSIIKSNLSYILGKVDAIDNEVVSARETTLKSLSRLEGDKSGKKLLNEADKLRQSRAEAKDESYRIAEGGS